MLLLNWSEVVREIHYFIIFSALSIDNHFMSYSCHRKIYIELFAKHSPLPHKLKYPKKLCKKNIYLFNKKFFYKKNCLQISTENNGKHEIFLKNMIFLQYWILHHQLFLPGNGVNRAYRKHVVEWNFIENQNNEIQAK